MSWSGEWVAARLGVCLHDLDRPVGVGLSELVGLAVRRNPRRAHLLVSSVLGKHVPTDPRLVYGAGLLLGRLVAGDTVPALLGEALRGSPGAAARLRDFGRSRSAPFPALVVGYAETATALGHAVADALGTADYLHSTRRPVAGLRPYGRFEEAHSHATSHLLLPAAATIFDGDGPVVLVDDELSTGSTALNTIRALHAVRPRAHYVLAALVDLRGPADRDRTAALAASLGVRIDAVALAAGRVELPPDVLLRGQELVAATPSPVFRSGSLHDHQRVALEWPASLPDGGRHGFSPEQRERLDKELPSLAGRLASALPPRARRVLVLGFEELMYAPLRLAEALADLLDGVEVRYSTSTRSPVLAVDDPGYAIRTRLAFPAHDDPADGPGERYAYNVAGGGFDAIVVVIDDIADTPAFETGLLDRLRSVAPVMVATVPAYLPSKGDAR